MSDSGLKVEGGIAMCEKCDQIETNIQHLRWLAAEPGMDSLSLGLMRSAVKALKFDRAALR
jgi:hypothetical protein